MLQKKKQTHLKQIEMKWKTFLWSYQNLKYVV